MTTYDNNLALTEMVGLPELYEIVQGAEIHYYTSWHTSLTFLGQVFTAAPIKRSGFQFDEKFSSVRVQVSAPMLDGFIEYISNQPIEPTKITIYRAVQDDLTEYLKLFVGFIQSVTLKGRDTTATCEANSDILDFAVPKFVYQSWCNHQVFDGGCTLSSSDYLVNATVSVISGASYTSVQLGSYANGYFTGGKAQFGSDMRLITNHVGNVITLQIPFDSRVAVTSVLECFPGCDGSPQTCIDKYDNLTNFLGMPYIPSKNPVIWGVMT